MGRSPIASVGFVYLIELCILILINLPVDHISAKQFQVTMNNYIIILQDLFMIILQS